jgi:hypothetical protein
MPPVAAIAIGALVSYAGVSGVVADVILSAGILDATAAGIAGSVIVGAGVGAAGSAITGGDPGQGALFGGLSGGLTQGLNAAVPNIGDLPSDATKAIETGAVSDALRLAQGQSLGKATEAGLLSGAGSYAGSQLTGALNSPGAPTTGGPSGGGNDPALNPVQVTPQVGTSAAGQTTSDPGTYQGKPIEQVVISPDQQAPSQSDLNLGSVLSTGASIGGKTAIGAAQYGISSLLGGNSYYQPSGGSASTSGSTNATLDASAAASGGATQSLGSAPGSAPGAATASAGQSGQAGSSSVYAPGSPIFGDSGSVTKPGVWNTASLRTPQAEGS